jgi:hypothetical protein
MTHITARFVPGTTCFVEVLSVHRSEAAARHRAAADGTQWYPLRCVVPPILEHCDPRVGEWLGLSWGVACGTYALRPLRSTGRALPEHFAVRCMGCGELYGPADWVTLRWLRADAEWETRECICGREVAVGVIF